MARYDNLLSFCSPYHVMFIADVLISQIFWLLKLMCIVWYLPPKFPQIQSQSTYFSKLSWGHAPRPPTICTITHTITHYTKYHTLTTYVALIREYHIFLDPIYLVKCVFTSRRIILLCPPWYPITSCCPPLAKTLK